MASYTINFTKKILDGITLPDEGRRDYYYDEKETGLILDVTSKGKKGFYLYKRIHGRPERVHLGAYPDLSIEQARLAAQRAKGKIAEGKNPQAEKRAIRGEMTFKDLFDQYMKNYSKRFKRSWQFDEREVNKFLSNWFNRKISSITKDEIYRLHLKTCNENGLYQANRILERIRAIFNKAIEWGWDGKNPSEGIKKFKEKSRERFITGQELPRFFASLEQEENHTARDFFKIALLTGARKGNVLQMRWEHLDLDSAIWHIPETKNGEPHKVALSAQAVLILKERRLKSESEWVFEGNGKQGYFNDPKKAWARVIGRADITDLRIHDLRRTLGSWQAATGASGFIIGKTLGHKSPLSTQVYARLDLDPVRVSLEKATEAMFASRSLKNAK